jgi:hypothetical protein
MFNDETFRTELAVVGFAKVKNNDVIKIRLDVQVPSWRRRFKMSEAIGLIVKAFSIATLKLAGLIIGPPQNEWYWAFGFVSGIIAAGLVILSRYFYKRHFSMGE